jgi:hypothetical protein
MRNLAGASVSVLKDAALAIPGNSTSALAAS